MDESEIFKNSGNQIMTINTIFQLMTLKELNRDVYEKADKLLMMPDLLFYMLTGKKVGEETIWSTTGLYNMVEGKISDTIFEKLDLRKGLVPDIVKAGEFVGNTKDSRLEVLRELAIDVIPVCTHDTASALLMTESFLDEDTMFLSCGTWSLIGSVVDRCIVDKEAYENNLTNELGYGSKPMFFKNITGLYLLEKYKQQLEEKLGRGIDFKEITEYVQSTREKVSHIDMEDPAFGAEGLDAKGEIDKYLSDRGLALPSGDFDYFTLIYESLVEKYRQVKEMVQEVLGKKFSKMHIIGGGARSRLLCGMICDKLEVTVKAGPAEASALGNIILQLYALGEIQEVSQGVKLALENEIIQYPPCRGDQQ